MFGTGKDGHFKFGTLIYYVEF